MSIAVSQELNKPLSAEVGSPSAKTDGVSAVGQATRIVMVVEYNGSHYFGFQLQSKLPSVQGELEMALEKLTGEKTRVLVASRTDTGVHARGQVVTFKTASRLSPRTFINGLNFYLPRDIAVREAYRACNSFSPRGQAVSREYSYYILNSPSRSPLWEGFSYLVGGGLDIEAMNRACQALIGEHDFASFASNLGVALKCTRRRVYRADFTKDGELVIFKIVANSFLPHQVRNTVGALIRVGLGRMTIDEFYSIMEAKKIGTAGPAAPACGLYLEKVNYEKDFKENDSENV
jgi:tRNA pseudouridine38-40 synthase